MDHNNILPVVLAGGKAKRFGGNKPEAKLRDKILIDYILSEILKQFNEVLIVANDPINHLSSNKILKIEDYKKNLGPLGGVLSAMKWVKENNKKYQWISTFPAETFIAGLNTISHSAFAGGGLATSILVSKFPSNRLIGVVPVLPG